MGVMHEHDTKPTVVPILFDNYISMIENSAGTNMFRHWYCLVNGARQEVMRDGNFACAFYVTSVLKLLDLVQDIQITVHRAMAELERSGWTPIDTPRKGAVVVWDAEPSQKDESWAVKTAKHIGFCLDAERAISNDSEGAGPKLHPLSYRPVLKYYWHPKFDA